MKKVISQVSLILLIMVIGFASVLISEIYAVESKATIKCPSSVKKGNEFTVSLGYPTDYDVKVAQAKVTVTYSDGSKQTDNIVYTVDEKLNFTVDTPAKFTAKTEGKATISITGIYMYEGDGTPVEEGRDKSTTITIEGTTPAPDTGSGSNTGSGANTGTGSNTGSGSNTGTGSNTGSGTNTGSGSNSGTGSNSGNGSNTGTGSNAGNNGGSTSTDNNTSTDSKEPKFTEVNETVYTTKKCNIRKSYSTDSEKIAVVEKDTKLTRKAIGDNGWSKVEYEGKTAYVYTEYLTKTEPEEEEVVFKDTHENLYAKQSCNLRASWSTDSEKVGYLEKGQPVERTGYSDNGWSRIIYEGKTVYVASRLLVVEKPEEDEEENTIANNTVVNTVNNVVENENIIEDPTNMSEEDRLKEIEEEVGVLPEVGINIANIAYFIVVAVAIIGAISGIIYYIKTKKEDC